MKNVCNTFMTLGTAELYRPTGILFYEHISREPHLFSGESCSFEPIDVIFKNFQYGLLKKEEIIDFTVRHQF